MIGIGSLLGGDGGGVGGLGGRCHIGCEAKPDDSYGVGLCQSPGGLDDDEVSWGGIASDNDSTLTGDEPVGAGRTSGGGGLGV